jgi:hypothetical protein
MVQNRLIETSLLVPILSEINPVLLAISYVSISILILSSYLRQGLATNLCRWGFPNNILGLLSIIILWKRLPTFRRNLLPPSSWYNYWANLEEREGSEGGCVNVSLSSSMITRFPEKGVEIPEDRSSRFSETLFRIYQVTRCHYLQDSNCNCTY